jgi:hypothetical protein
MNQVQNLTYNPMHQHLKMNMSMRGVNKQTIVEGAVSMYKLIAHFLQSADGLCVESFLR